MLFRSRVIAERPEAAAALAAAGQDLRAALESAGLDLGELDLQLASDPRCDHQQRSSADERRSAAAQRSAAAGEELHVTMTPQAEPAEPLAGRTIDLHA